jgi:pimeloyl-ACP methyl ester carboxylesterase
MYLERVSCEPPMRPQPAPVVFVHGAWHGAWCWSEHFLGFFARHGYASNAFDLRGHGKSESGRRLRWASLADYVADLDQIVRTLDVAPVLVGHSMGGAVVQKYLETHQAAAAVIVAGLPPSGAIPATLRLAARHPIAVLKANATLSLRHLVATPRLARDAFFSEDIPVERLNRYFSRLQDESYRVFLDMLALNLPRPGRVKTPILVLGAERDTFFTRAEVEATARAYRAEVAFFPMAHNVMLEDGWEDVAGYIVRWLARLNLAQPDASI